MNEFDFIRTYLAVAEQDRSVLLGIGDDAAIIRPHADRDLCISSDMLLAGRHFFANDAPRDMAHKILAVNLSDMAAMGAAPKWVLLSAALPELDKKWLDEFCSRFFAVCREYGVSLIGGDTTKGGLAFNITIIGDVPKGKGLRRGNARVGDDIWLSGQVGVAAAGLQHQLGKTVLPPALAADCRQALLRPIPRVALGQALLDIAHAAQDVSDGLVQDLEHILQASSLGGEIWLERLPVLPGLEEHLTQEMWRQCVLAGGDDYELLFTAAPERRSEIERAAEKSNTPVSRIGRITDTAGLSVLEHGQNVPLAVRGFDHFS
ncbi:Thiamine-monophosphate kinase [Kingella potus]|uniref:Thiamine-monophosphate kinase n=1 Tax=Kingella potus TaxID=265175 RepID=A0A377R0B3_9NEIS|nr:thiamine-phosphate kinase [Kingella potus]UOP01952.1 thiamine-phosphate kinase [Kingella potus]STR00692.1 Thiamine-monophosphate kinase [Kingella potus]